MSKGAYNKQQAHSDRQLDYMRGLSTTVGRACDAWLDKKGLKNKSWKEQNNEAFKKQKVSK
tara:strand:- start:60 stop:242 length:183 start_codon:yes stop_codon:yes gene_type:complete